MNEIQERRNPAPRYNPVIIPGGSYYEHLCKTVSPTKLKRMMEDERKRYQETHALGWQEAYENKLADAHAHTNQWQKQTSDSKLLGLDTIKEPITKRGVRNAFYRAARKLHPDAGGNEEAFKQLHDAYRRVLAATKA